MTCRFDQKQYDILRRCSEQQNISEWNSYRAEQPETPICLENADLRSAILEGAQLGACCLEGAQFEGANLLAADLRGADLRKADFSSANLWGVTLSEANLEGACLVSANLENADLRKANLEQANLRSANLEGVIVEDSELRQAHLEQANPQGEGQDGAIVQFDVEESLSGLKQDQEVTFYLAEDITYREVVSLMKCMESLSLIVGASAPRINEIKFNLGLEGDSAWDRGELGNLIALTVPLDFAEILPDFFPVKVVSGQLSCDESEMESETSMNPEPPKGFKSFMGNAGFSEIEQKIAHKNLKLHNIEERHLMEDLRTIAHLVECRRILFHV